jgi:hypothetical protein
MTLTREQYEALIHERIFAPTKLSDALRNRKRRSIAGDDGNLLIIAADHTSRGKLSLGSDRTAMADRFTLLERTLSVFLCRVSMASSAVRMFWKNSRGLAHWRTKWRWEQ